MTRLIFAAITLAACCGPGGDVGVETESERLSDPPAESDDGAVRPAPVAGELAVSIGQPFELQLEETTVVEEGLGVRFEAVIEDSRCPADVQCVWEGNATIAIDVAMNGETGASLQLSTNPGFPTEATYLGYSFELVDLEPYPRTDSEDGQPYRATLVTDHVIDVPASPSPSAPTPPGRPPASP